MKIFLAAIALTIASPALAQTAAPANPHAGHQDRSAPTTAQPLSNPDSGHDMGKMSAEAMMAHCEEMKARGKTMEGCDMQAGTKPGSDPHAGHKMSPK